MVEYDYGSNMNKNKIEQARGNIHSDEFTKLYELTRDKLINPNAQITLTIDNVKVDAQRYYEFEQLKIAGGNPDQVLNKYLVNAISDPYTINPLFLNHLINSKFTVITDNTTIQDYRLVEIKITVSKMLWERFIFTNMSCLADLREFISNQIDQMFAEMFDENNRDLIDAFSV